MQMSRMTLKKDSKGYEKDYFYHMHPAQKCIDSLSFSLNE